MDVPPEVVWQGYIRMPFNDVSGVAELWAKSCSSFAIAEHPAEGKTEHVHVHMMLVNSSLKINTLQKQMKKMGVSPGKGKHWISETVIEGEYAGERYRRNYLLKYLLKGSETRLKWVKNISPAEVEEAVSSWVEPVLGNDTKAKSSKKKDTQTYYKVCQEILAKAKSSHPEWFRSAITNYYAEDEDEFTLQRQYYRNIWDLMIKELNTRGIRTSINELERFYTTMMRNDREIKTLLFTNFMKKIGV